MTHGLILDPLFWATFAVVMWAAAALGLASKWFGWFEDADEEPAKLTE